MPPKFGLSDNPDAQVIWAHPETWLNATGGGGGSGGISSRSTQTRAAAAYAMQQLLGMASTKLERPGREPLGLERHDQRWRPDGHLRPADRRPAVQLRHADHGRERLDDRDPVPAGDRHHQAGEPVLDRRQGGPADRHPEQGARGTTPTSRTCAFPAWCTPASFVHAAPAPTRSRTTSRSASTRTRSPTSRALRSCRSTNFLAVVAPLEYDAIQAAAQLQVVWQTANRSSRPRRATTGRGCARRATRTRRPRRAGSTDTGACPPRSPPPRRPSRRPTSTTTTTSSRSARTARSQTSRHNSASMLRPGPVARSASARRGALA